MLKTFNDVKLVIMVIKMFDLCLSSNQLRTLHGATTPPPPIFWKTIQQSFVLKQWKSVTSSYQNNRHAPQFLGKCSQDRQEGRVGGVGGLIL